MVTTNTKKLVELKWLSLSNINLEEIKCYEYKDLKSLTHLDLSKNNINQVAADPFLETPNRRKITASKMRRPTLSSHPLEFLNLSCNKIVFLNFRTFLTLQKLTTLDLSNNRIHDLYLEILTPLKSLKFLHLQYNDIVNINHRYKYGSRRSKLPSHVYIVDGPCDANYEGGYCSSYKSHRSKSSRKVSQCSQRYPTTWSVSLDLFDVSNNNIHKLTNNIFAHLKILSINLSHNVFEEKILLNSLNHLKELDLKHNTIRVIKNTTFRKLLDITEINCANNNISFIENESFRKLLKLKQLHLSYNIINRLNGKMLIGLKKLTVLNLSHNVLQYIHNNTFEELNSLLHLDISHNAIISLSTVLHMKHAISLNLSFNYFTNISQKSFQFIREINFLDFSGNFISLIGNNTVPKVNNELILKCNKLVSFGWSVFVNGNFTPNLNTVKKLDLNENNLNCSKETCWIKHGISEGWIRTHIRQNCWKNCSDISRHLILALPGKFGKELSYNFFPYLRRLVSII